MPAWYARLKGRHIKSTVDHELAATQAAYQVGALQIFLQSHAVESNNLALTAGWTMEIAGPTIGPFLLKRIEINNPDAAAVNSFSLAIMSVFDGAPGASNAFLAWNTVIGPLEVWRWTGEVPLCGRWVYAKCGVVGLTMFWEAEEMER